jgi:hypothetical protein
MQTLKIKTGLISLQIVDDDGIERGVFSFNPADVKVARRVTDLIEDYKVKQVEFNKKQESCETTEDRIKLLDEIVDYFKDSINTVWGENSSKVLFGNASTLQMFDDFFDGIAPYYQKESKKRISKYTK